MSIIRFRYKNVFLIGKRHHLTFSTLINENEYTREPQYPPILDTRVAAHKVRTKKEWHNKIASLRTVEEKLFAINVPKYYGWNSLVLKEGTVPYNSLPLTQFITRTHLIDNLPECYSEDTVEAASTKILTEIKSHIEEALISEYSYQRAKYELTRDNAKALSPAQLDNIIGESVVQQINRILLAKLSPEISYLLEAQVDFQPRLESFWFVGQIEPPKVVRKSRENVDRLKDVADEPIDRCIQYSGSPTLQLRSENPLDQFVELKEYNDAELPVPTFTYDPRVLGLNFDHVHGTNIPGFWPGDESEFGLLSFHNRGHVLNRPFHYGEKDLIETLQAQAILASFGWTLGQACYQGFSTFNDVTYPLTTQTVITNGQFWSFYAYQLNTTLLHSEHATSNPRRNICWGTSEAKLFEEVEGEKLIGFNGDVLKSLIKFYLRAPQIREGVNMKPYLDKHAPHVADISDDSRRIWIESQFKHMYSNRPRHALRYEVYDWERIYKIDNNTRPFDKKRRPFELGEHPLRRRYDEHTPKYVPKKFRPEDKKNRSKWSKTYYV